MTNLCPFFRIFADLLLFATPNPSNCVRRFFHEKQNHFESLIEDMIILWFENRNCKSAVATIFEKKVCGSKRRSMMRHFDEFFDEDYKRRRRAELC